MGREAELSRFAAALEDPGSTVSVLVVHGPAGVGKSTLVGRFAEIARERGLDVLALDARDLAASSDALQLAVGPVLEPTAGSRPRPVLLVDTYELLADLDAWFREDLLPRLPADVLVVLAGRNAPAAGWRSDPGWTDMLEELPLRNLSPQDSLRYLDAVEVPADRRQGCVDFTHGYPLALALAGEVARAGDVAPRDSPDLVRDLLHRLLDDVPAGGPYRAALEAVAVVRVLTEPLLAAMLGTPDAREVFDWLRGLPIVGSGPSGAFPHDLARDVLDADLRWRDPRRHAELHARAREYYLGELPATPPQSRQGLLLDLMYLHASLRLFLLGAPADGAGLRLLPLEPDDVPGVLELVERHEGPAAVPIAGYWLRRAPGAWSVLRDRRGGLGGVMMMLQLETADAADAAADPAVAAALEELARRAPLRPGERATHLRFWMGAESYQQIGAEQNLIAARWAVHYLTMPGLAITFTPFADPASWEVFCAYADQGRMPGADFEVGGRRYGVFGHDWRAVPPAAWVRLLTEREQAEVVTEPPAPAPDAALLVLSREEFAGSVRAALRDLQRPDRLARNPLLRSRLVQSRAPDTSAAARARGLRDLIGEAAAALEASPRDARAYRAVNRTYLRPAGTQERAAEVLGLPSSTYRRHLADGVERMVELLWDREVGA